MTVSIKDLAEKYQLIKRLRAELAERDREMKADQDEVERQLLQQLDESGVDSANIKDVGTVYKLTETVPTVEDWETFTNYIRDNDMLFLFQRRVSAAAYRELLAQGGEIKGVKPTTITKLILRKK